MSANYQSWGRFPRLAQRARHLFWPDDAFHLDDLEAPLLPYGLGRSYGDVCLTEGGTLLVTRGLNRFVSLSDDGLLRCEAGVSLAEILEVTLPRGWFLPVTPGTKFVTVGGAIANDIHGKNHHQAGAFGCHVRRFELARSDGRRLVCSADSNPEWFAATIGGLGLTGVILWAEIQMTPVASAFLDVETRPFGNLSEALDLSRAAERDFTYTVAWLDCLARGSALGRGVLFCGNHRREPSLPPARPPHALRVPCDLPSFCLQPWGMRLWNAAYHRAQLHRPARRIEHYEPFFYPLDAVLEWNRIYGPKGFLQYQCVVPHESAPALAEILARTAASGRGSFLSVLKTFGDMASPGMLSFPRHGITLTLDFPNRPEIFPLLAGFDEIVSAAGGRVYPAKDARMSAAFFQASYPRWREFASFVDPKFSSRFWRRVTACEKS